MCNLNYALAGVAMSNGVDWPDVFDSGALDAFEGAVDIYQCLAEMVVMSEKIAERATELNLVFPGVYAYEVQGGYGAIFGELLVEDKEWLPEKHKHALGKLAAEFFTQGTEGLPEANIVDLLLFIRSETGYDHAG